MKKIITLILSLSLCAALLTGCAKSTPKPAQSTRSNLVPEQVQAEQNQPEQPQAPQTVPQPRDDDMKYFMPPIPGVRKLYRRLPCGEYSAEYVHTPYGEQKDETLSYILTLNRDDTYQMTVVKQGVTAEHSGRYYLRDNGIMLFYDEEIIPPAHNVFVSDCMYGDILAKHKIMIYDGCNTIVLAHTVTPDQVEQQSR